MRLCRYFDFLNFPISERLSISEWAASERDADSTPKIAQSPPSPQNAWATAVNAPPDELSAKTFSSLWTKACVEIICERSPR